MVVQVMVPAQVSGVMFTADPVTGRLNVGIYRGMVGEKLSVDVACVSAETLAMRNVELVLHRCHLQIEALTATPYASGLSTLVDDESSLGVACIDFRPPHPRRAHALHRFLRRYVFTSR